jgi:VanZ family protein
VLVRAPAPLALMALIFWLSAQSDPGADIGALGRIAAHGGEYFLLTLLWAWALAPAIGQRAAAAAAAIAFAYAISDEVHQLFVQGRDADPFDLAVDAVGIGLALALLSRLRRRGASRRSPTSPGSDLRPS